MTISRSIHVGQADWATREAHLFNSRILFDQFSLSLPRVFFRVFCASCLPQLETEGQKEIETECRAVCIFEERLPVNILFINIFIHRENIFIRILNIQKSINK